MSEAQVRAVEKSRIESLLRGDLDSFAELCDDRLIYTHSVGRRDDKESMLLALKSGLIRYLSIEHDLEDIQIVGSAACVTGRMQAEIRAAGETRALDSLTTSVWIQSGQGWRLLAFHATNRA